MKNKKGKGVCLLHKHEEFFRFDKDHKGFENTCVDLNLGRECF